MSELDDLRGAVRDLLDTHAPVRSAMTDTVPSAGDLDRHASLWKRLAVEMGLTALGAEDVPFSWVTGVLEETGRVLLRSPYLSTVVAARALRDAGDEAHLAGLADGSVTAALALDGNLDQVVDAAGASLLLLASGQDLVAVTDFAAEPLEPLDPTRPQARVTVRTPGRVVAPVGHARDLHWTALAAESVGAAQRILELAVEHLKVREQFGRPLGSFQALRHRVADLTVLVESATSTTWYAAQATNDLPVAAPLAKATASDAFTTVAGECIQLFGGIGFTWEHDAHLYFKRAWTTALMHGDNRTLRRLAFERSNA